MGMPHHPDLMQGQKLNNHSTLIHHDKTRKENKRNEPKEAEPFYPRFFVCFIFFLFLSFYHVIYLYMVEWLFDVYPCMQE